MTFVAQYDWTVKPAPDAGEISGGLGEWGRQSVLLLSDVDRHGNPTPIDDIHVGDTMTVTSPVGGAEMSVSKVDGLKVTVGISAAYRYPIEGQIVNVRWATPAASGDFDPTPLWAAINTEVTDREDGDEILQDQIDSHTHDTSHTHDDYAQTDHNHDVAYSPAGHAHPHDHDGSYQPKGDYAAASHTHADGEGGGGGDAGPHDHDGTYQPLGDYAADDHAHDGDYAPIHEHPYAATDHTHDDLGGGDGGPHDHDEFTEIQTKQDEQDARLDSIEAGDASQIGQYEYNSVPSQDGQVAWDDTRMYFRDKDLGGYAFAAPKAGDQFYIRVNDISIVGDISSSTLSNGTAVVTGSWEPALPDPNTGDKVTVNSTEAALDTLHGQVKDLEQTVTDLDDAKASNEALQQVRLDTVGADNIDGMAIWMGTQADYDALATKRASTLFVVV